MVPCSALHPAPAPADRVVASACAPFPSKWSTGTCGCRSCLRSLPLRVHILVRERAAAVEVFRHADDRTRRNARAGDAVRFADQIQPIWTVSGQGGSKGKTG